LADELLQDIAIETDGEERVYTWNSKPFRVVIACMRDLGEFGKLIDKMEARHKALKLKKGKLPVQIPQALYEGVEDKLTGAVKLGDDKIEVYLTSEREIDTATVLEMGLREPAMPWARAVMFIKLNVKLAAAILKDFQDINGEVAHAEAKKGSDSTQDQPEEAEPNPDETEAN
jgi:hypothetical protein